MLIFSETVVLILMMVMTTTTMMMMMTMIMMMTMLLLMDKIHVTHLSSLSFKQFHSLVPFMNIVWVLSQ